MLVVDGGVTALSGTEAPKPMIDSEMIDSVSLEEKLEHITSLNPLDKKSSEIDLSSHLNGLICSLD